ncbi:MAG: indolepyruvate oxidoreductase subunit beta [Candidatus Thermoplasmatota archaeon]|nr:indolepyruvate oxidoreductase subunit beta [Candidatus Thermoplasmatota archaeon]
MMEKGVFSIYMAGVGGQGLVLLSNVIGSACAKAGIRALTGEQHGLSQRSGSINVHMRIGQNIRSPLIPIGGADVLLSLEALEALRYVEYLQQGGVVLMNSRIQHPIAETALHVKDKSATYFSVDEVRNRLSQVTDKIAIIDALALGRDAGNPMTENIIMLGALSVIEAFPVPEKSIRESIAENVPKKAVDANLKAFEQGKGHAYEHLCNVIKCRK